MLRSPDRGTNTVVVYMCVGWGVFSVGEGSKLKIACTCSIVSYLHYINLNGLYI